MAVAGAAEVIGLIGDAAGLVEMAVGYLPDGYDGASVAVRIGAGKMSDAAAGGWDQIKAYDDSGAIVGTAGSGSVGTKGTFTDVQVKQATGQQATWIDILGSDDAICIPYISVAWNDGSKYAWLGDWGYSCGLTWYEGGIYVDGGSYAPKCTWTDANHEDGVEVSHLSIHMPSFAGKNKDSDNPSDYCGGNKFHAYREHDANRVFKRSPKPKNEFTNLVVSRMVSNATALCESATSRGPDFVSEHEGVYCDMQTRDTLPVCTGNSKTDCFDLESNAMQKRDGSVVRKRYSSIDVWE